MEKPRHARIAADFWDHPDTSWMAPLHRDIFTQACAANALGVLELPLARIAKRCKSTVESVEIAMHQMVEDSRAVALWWRDWGIFWVCKAPKYNCCNPMMWRNAHKVWRAQPDEVRVTIAMRWPRVSSANMSPNDPTNIEGAQPLHEVDFSSVSVSESALVVLDPVSAKAAHEDAECDAVRNALPWIFPAGLRPMLYRDERVRGLVRTGITAEEIIDTLKRFSALVEDGSIPKDLWTATYFFSGHYDRLRNLGAGERKDKVL